jgi:hypothetical protein
MVLPSTVAGSFFNYISMGLPAVMAVAQKLSADKEPISHFTFYVHVNAQNGKFYRKIIFKVIPNGQYGLSTILKNAFE